MDCYITKNLLSTNFINLKICEMKKQIIIVCAAICAMIYFSGCEKEIVTTAFQIDSTQTATFQLYLRGELDASSDGMESIEDGTKVLISVNYSSLNPNFTGMGRWKTEATTSNGMVSVEVPATDNGVPVYVRIDDFEHDYVVDETTTQWRLYKYSSTFSGVTAGTTNIFYGTLGFSVLEEYTN